MVTRYLSDGVSRPANWYAHLKSTDGQEEDMTGRKSEK